MFQFTKLQLRDSEEIAHCPSCTLAIRVIFDPDDFVGHDSEENAKVPVVRYVEVEA